jgi:hypothetical protein
MKASIVFGVCGILAFPAACTRGQEPPKITGYVTRVASASDFDANGIRVLCGAETLSLKEVSPNVDDTTNGCPRTPPYIGEVVTVYGSMKKKKHAVDATQIVFSLPIRAGVPGSAVIEALKEPASAGPQPAGCLVRADGYWIRIDAKTELKFTSPLHSLADVKPGNWMEYKGVLGPDGVITAAAVKIGPNIVSKGEEKLRAKNEFDPSAVPADTRQNSVERALVGGYDPKKFPPYINPEMQARVNAIGEKLIPAFQRELPDSDPAKIHFRFQLIDTRMFRDAGTLPNGIILIPHQVVERMQNDSQLATVLADNIACALERQQYRSQAALRWAAAATLGEWASLPIGGPAILAGEAVTVGGMETSSDIAARNLEQSGRVSLELLNDAGYDIDQAPMAWWLLDPKGPKPVAEVAMPPRAAYLYWVLGETWHNPAANAPQAH